MSTLKLVCGVYLLYLGFKAGRAALTPDPAGPAAGPAARPDTTATLYRQGLVMHLTNAKAVLGWIALMTLGLGPSANWTTVAAILAGCALLGAMIFAGYAIVFSSAPMVRTYRRAR